MDGCCVCTDVDWVLVEYTGYGEFMSAIRTGGILRVLLFLRGVQERDVPRDSSQPERVLTAVCDCRRLSQGICGNLHCHRGGPVTTACLCARAKRRISARATSDCREGSPVFLTARSRAHAIARIATLLRRRRSVLMSRRAAQSSARMRFARALPTDTLSWNNDGPPFADGCFRMDDSGLHYCCSRDECIRGETGDATICNGSEYWACPSGKAPPKPNPALDCKAGTASATGDFCCSR